jgi:hypothetical protein
MALYRDGKRKIMNSKESKIKKMHSRVEVFVSKERQARLWMLVALLILAVSVWDRQSLVSKLNERPLFFAMDANTFYVSRLGTFEEAREFHAEASRMAAECLFSRNPNGPDFTARRKLLFGRNAYQESEHFFGLDSERFEQQQIHEKIEIAKVDILQPNSGTVLTAVRGQVIDAGVFDGRPFANSRPVTIYFQLALNKEMASNSRYPEFVVKYDIHEGEK